jgi:hypothetical protein
LQASLRRVLEDSSFAASLGVAARDRVMGGLTTRHFAAAIAPILRAVATSKSSPESGTIQA